MIIQIEVENCSDCPYLGHWHEFGHSSTYCTHEDADTGIDGIGYNSAYQHNNDRLPEAGISYLCPFRRKRGSK